MFGFFNFKQRQTAKLVKKLFDQYEKIEDQKVQYLVKMYELCQQKEATINGLINLNARLEAEKKDLIIGAYQKGARDFIETNYPDELYNYDLQSDS